MNRIAALLLFLAAAAVPAAQPPNIVMILSDDQAWTDFGFMGHPTIQTPHLDKLASQSLLFPRGYVPSSLCCPSLATAITGLYPHQNNITGNEPPIPIGPNGKPDKRLPEYARQVQECVAFIDHVPTLPRMLAQKGYLSLQTGKWWQGHYRRGGFTHGMTHGDPKRGGRHGDEGLKIGREGMQPIFDFLDEAGDKPFFIWYAPFLPHSPHNPPERLLNKYRDQTNSIHVARYWAMCEWFDETCGQLLDRLDQKGLAENTVVLFVTDNGWIQSSDNPRYAPRSKRSQYDGGLRTPIMVRWPAHVAPRVDDTPVSSIDLVPTVLAACGLEPTDSMQGVNLLDRRAVRKRKTLFGEIFLHNAVDIHRPEKNLTYRWCIEDNWKLILSHMENVTARAHERGTGQIELYNLLKDPFEQNNLAETSPRQVVRLARKINEWWPAQ